MRRSMARQHQIRRQTLRDKMQSEYRFFSFLQLEYEYEGVMDWHSHSSRAAVVGSAIVCTQCIRIYE